MKNIPRKEIKKNSSLNSSVISKSAFSPRKIENLDIKVVSKEHKRSSYVSVELKSEKSPKSVLNYSDIFNSKR